MLTDAQNLGNSETALCLLNWPFIYKTLVQILGLKRILQYQSTKKLLVALAILSPGK